METGRNNPESRCRGVSTIPVIAVCCGLATTAALGLWMSERSRVRALDRERSQSAAALEQAKMQIQDLANRVKTLTEKSVETRGAENKSAEAKSAENPVVAPVPAAPRVVSSATRKRLVRPVPVDPRLDRFQGELTKTQKELASTREELSSVREQTGKDKEELNGKINSTRDDLNGSIARTHDEVVALQKRGEQNVYEFKLTKSKEMHRVGSLSLSLRGANAKHKTYDLAMIVDDNALTKKNINLYEPVWITLSDRPQPVQLVVNHVEKNEIEGYVSEPKYRKSELLANSGQSAQKPQPELSTRN